MLLINVPDKQKHPKMDIDGLATNFCILQLDGAHQKRTPGGKFAKGKDRQTQSEYKCKNAGCEDSFAYQSSLDRHSMNVHSIRKDFIKVGDFIGRKRICPDDGCRRTFKKKAVFVKHLQEEHKMDINAADECVSTAKEVFPEKFTKKHICHGCNAGFSTPKGCTDIWILRMSQQKLFTEF